MERISIRRAITGSTSILRVITDSISIQLLASIPTLLRLTRRPNL